MNSARWYVWIAATFALAMLLGAQEVEMIGGHKAVGSATGRHNDRQTASHGFEHGHAESFAPIGQDQAIAGGIERGHLF